MVLGISLPAFTMIHVLISLIGIVSGLVVMYGLLANHPSDKWTVLFLATTALTSLTGFLFPFHGVTPGIVVGVISMAVLAIAALVRYPLHLAWRKTYVVAAGAALYFNVFVLLVQSFEKVPALHALAPTQKEPPFAIAQLAVLLAFIVLTVRAAKRFRAPAASSAAPARAA